MPSSTIADKAAPSGSNVEHLGSDDPQAAMVAGARQESIEELKSDTLPLQAQEGGGGGYMLSSHTTNAIRQGHPCGPE